MFCPECGYKNPDNGDECLNCGTSLKDPPEDSFEVKAEEAPEEILPETPEVIPDKPPEEQDKNMLRLRAPLSQTPKESEAGEEAYDVHSLEEEKAEKRGELHDDSLMNNRYKILDVIHQSGKSIIYRASDISSGEMVVIKEMTEDHKKESDSLIAVEQYRKALDTLEQLSYEGISRILDNFSEGRKYYVVKTLAKGKSLSQLMKDRNDKPVAQEEAVKWSLGILKVLDYFSNLNPPFFFRNLQPANIMVDEWDNVCLVDFDLDRILSESGSVMPQGLPGFMAPEQFKNIVDGRSAIYSLGMIIRYLMTGIDPSDQKNRYRRYKRIKDINIKVDKWFDDIVLSMVEKSPDYRPGSAKELIALFQSKTNAQPAGAQIQASPVKPAGIGTPETYAVPPTASSKSSQSILPSEEQKKTGGFRNYFIIFVLLAVIGIPTVFFLAVVFGPGLYSSQKVTEAAKALEAKDYDKALEDLKIAREIDGKNPKIHQLTGKAYVGKKDYDNAVDSYMKAIRYDKNLEKELNKDIAAAYYEKGAAAVKSGDYNQAALDLKEAFGYNPELLKSDDPTLLFYRGLLAHYQDRKLEEAISAYTKSLKKETNADVLIARAAAHIDAGNYARAKFDLDDAVKKDPAKKPVAEMKIQQLLEKARKTITDKLNTGDVDGSLSDLEQINKTFGSGNPEMVKLHGAIYLRKAEDANRAGNIDDGLKLLNKSIQLDPASARAYMARSFIHSRQKNWDKAIADLKKCGELDPKVYGKNVAAQIRNIERMKQSQARITTRYPVTARPTPARTSTPTRAASEQYYIMGGSAYNGYIAKKHNGGMYLLKGSGYLTQKKWHPAEPSGYHKVKIFSDNYGRSREYEFKAEELHKFTVTYVSNATTRRTTTKRTPGKTTRTYTYSGSSKTSRVTIQTESGSALFLEGYSAGRYLQRGKTYYGTQSGSNLELFVGSGYSKMRFPIKGSGGIY